MMVSTHKAKDWPFPNDPEPRDAVLPLLRVKPWMPLHAAPRIYLINAQVIDTEEGKLFDGLQTIEIIDGHIASIGLTDSFTYTDTKAPKIDLDSRFVCPGLIDAHVHISAIPGSNTIADMVRTNAQVTTLRSTYVLKSMLSRGFTTIRDTGGATKDTANAIAEGLLEGPRLFQCGFAISQTGGHGDFSPAQSGGDGLGCCSGHSGSLGRTADGVPAVLKATREELKQGADFIKIMVGGGVASETDAIETVQYSAEEIRAITSTAWQMGKKMCTAHAYTPEAIEHAVSNGVRGIEHGNLIEQKTAEMMARKGIYLTPTLSCYGIMVRRPFENFLPPSGQIKNKQVMQQGLEALRMADEAGVTICYGSDLLISMHALQTEEFTVRSRILPAAKILKHATVNPAKMLGQEGKLGVVRQGAFGDLIVLKKNPLEDICVLDRPEENLIAVIKEGRLVSGELVGFPK
ncbi:hypothetical protein BD324DRAFT_619980 [Kockovaella imperatae]|uniref:Amidohydrolase-related domain-containing protein n=1 Tax=Kockovaella imperatae TaxID=4999 RepID=A0A1Y1UJQ0_9TREE|nr:hypothetical protein BD324DRAFT_619980 [Kockovaella imperatae]ORX38209.1 hypothetical protein BD324DRAFT_619980 [Kockovaella imperatae]